MQYALTLEDALAYCRTRVNGLDTAIRLERLAGLRPPRTDGRD